MQHVTSHLAVPYAFVFMIYISPEIAQADQIISISDQNVTCDNLTDVTDNLNEALKFSSVVHLSPGQCRVRRTVDVPSGHSLLGSGRVLTHVIVDHRFERKAEAVIRCEAKEPGCTIDGLEISFDQPDTSSRQDLISYPAGIKIVDAPRTRLSHLRITGARVAVDAEGNTGGLLLDDVEVSAFDTALSLDGALDTVRINNLHLWPFGLTRKQQAIMQDSETTGIRSGRVDGLLVNGFVALDVQNALSFFNSSIHGGPTFGTMINSGLDDASSIKCVGDARFTISASYWTIGSLRPIYNYIDGCSINISDSRFFISKDIAGDIFSLHESRGLTSFLFANSIVSTTSPDVSIFSLRSSTREDADRIKITGNIFQVPSAIFQTDSRSKIHIDGLSQEQIRHVGRSE